MAGHTQGPWVCLKKWVLMPELVVCGGKHPHFQHWIANCGSALSDERKANAKLIAAAPTMYGYIEGQAARGDKDAATILASIERAGP